MIAALASSCRFMLLHQFRAKTEISSNAKPVDAACVFRAAEGSTCRLAGALRPRERTW